jgi:hypothetical protein
MPRPLKVYRAHIGFFDTVVAVHSQKEALVAWGGSSAESRHGFASLTNDVKAVTAALKNPGVALYRPFGSSGQYSTKRTLSELPPEPRNEVREPEGEKKAGQQKAERKRLEQERAEQQKAQKAKAREEKQRLERERQHAREQVKLKLESLLHQIDQEKRELDRRRAEARAEYDATLAELKSNPHRA